MIVAENARSPIDGGTVLVTGASAGIGRELAVQLAPRAKALILLARRAARLEELRASLLARHPQLEALTLPVAGLSDNHGLIWTVGILLRIRRLGARVPPSAPAHRPSQTSHQPRHRIARPSCDSGT